MDKEKSGSSATLVSRKSTAMSEKFHDKMRSIPPPYCHSMGAVSIIAIVVCLVLGGILVATNEDSGAARTAGFTLLYVGGLLVIVPIIYACYVAKYKKKLFGKWEIRKSKKRPPLELVATDGMYDSKFHSLKLSNT